MATSVYADSERSETCLPVWRNGIVTIFVSTGFRKKPKRFSFPCTEENQLVLERLERQQEANRLQIRRRTLRAARSPNMAIE
jgi:hypothetical protein